MAIDEEPVGASRRRRVLRSPFTILAIVSLAAAALAGAFTAYYEYTRPSVYQSSSALLIDQAPAIAASGDEGVLAKLSRLRFKYAGIATTEAFDAQVAQQAGVSPGRIIGRGKGRACASGGYRRDAIMGVSALPRS